MKKAAVYGIPNCDTTMKALNWLTQNKVPFTFHDYKQQGIKKEKLGAWCKKLGWEKVFNKKSTTWRQLGRAEQDKIIDAPAAISLMMQHNSIIKRPVIEIGENVLAGFNETEITKHVK